jgi:hypothetical protein
MTILQFLASDSHTLTLYTLLRLEPLLSVISSLSSYLTASNIKWSVLPVLPAREARDPRPLSQISLSIQDHREKEKTIRLFSDSISMVSKDTTSYALCRYSMLGD